MGLFRGLREGKFEEFEDQAKLPEGSGDSGRHWQQYPGTWTGDVIAVFVTTSTSTHYHHNE